MTKQRLFTIAGTVWSLVGLFLFVRGLIMYQLAMNEQQASTQAVGISAVISLVIGGVKGKFVLSKTAQRNKARIEALPGPFEWHDVYAKPFYFFIVAMMLLGIFLRTFNEWLGGYVVVAAIYCGIGLALMVSSLCYWKSGAQPATESGS